MYMSHQVETKETSTMKEDMLKLKWEILIKVKMENQIQAIQELSQLCRKNRLLQEVIQQPRKIGATAHKVSIIMQDHKQ